METNEIAVDPNEIAVDPSEVAVDPNEVAVDLNEVAVDPNEVAVEPNETAVEPNETAVEPNETAQEKLFRKVFGWVILIATSVWGLFAGGFLAYHSAQPNSWLLDLIQNHFAALMGVPMAALMAMCVVILLRYSAGPIEFSVPGAKFKGASGQAAFWVVCFLAIVTALKLLW